MTISTQELEKEFIAILDFGSQYSQLIARRIRENQVYSQIVPFHIPVSKLIQMNPKGIILSGGPASVYQDKAPKCDPALFNLDIPILGICYGMQLMMTVFNGEVRKCEKREFGRADVTITNPEDLFYGVSNHTTVWMSHGDETKVLPKDFTILGHTENAKFASVKHRTKKIYGLQFHPEVMHTDEGNTIIRNFLSKICGCSHTWTMKDFAETIKNEIKSQVGDRKIICGLSGGVDSSVAAKLVHDAVGEQLTCIFVNNGLLRKNEAEKVIATFRDNFKMKLHYVDATEEFLGALKDVTDPEQKRKIIGEKFIRVFEKASKQIGNVMFLAQGTLYPDVIESISPTGGPSVTIKSHHNVGGLPKDLSFELVEPLRDLFKDEVRALGRELDLPEDVLMRQPFPGPGLAVRIIGNVTPNRLEVLRNADVVVIEEIKKAGMYRNVWQSFAVLLPLKSVGIMGDERTYEYTIAIRAVHSFDGMTADWVRLDPELLARISNRIINEVRGVNRVVYDISSKPPSTIEWE